MLEKPFLLLVLAALIIVLAIFLPANAVAASPFFTRYNIKDDAFDWIDMSNRTKTLRGEPATDIVGVSYFSDGRTLNTTLWLIFPFMEHPSKYTTLNYGVLIDSDFDSSTGVGGIDYQVEIRWMNKTRTWDKVTMEWSDSGKEKILDEKRNYTGFYKKQSYYVSLPVDLSTIVYPNKYRVIFYAESAKGGPLITDFTKWAYIPPPNLAITTSPNPVVIRQGEKKTVEVQINATQGFEPYVHLYPENKVSGLDLDFKYNAIHVPSDGFATTPLIISTSKNISASPYTLSIFANSTFPSLKFIKADETNLGTPKISQLSQSESTISRSSLLLTVEDALSDIDKLSEFWNKLGSPILFVYGIIAGISPWIFSKIKNKLKNSRKNLSQ
jgi:hypothetical protein